LKTAICVVVVALAGGKLVAATIDDVIARAEALRNGGQFAEAVVVLREAIAAAPQNQRAHRLLAQTLAWSKDFTAAERAYRAALTRWPDDYELRAGLAQTLLWSNRFREGERLFSTLLLERPDDGVVLLGAAQGAYWAGDYRTAIQRFERIVASDPANADATRALEELRALMRSPWEIRGQNSDDTQPLRRSTVFARAAFFSDPLTRWDLRASSSEMQQDPRERTMWSIGASGTTTIPSVRTTLTAGVDRQWFDDDSAENLLNALAVWRIGTESVSVGFDQFTLLGTASAIEARETASRLSVIYRHERENGLDAAVTAHRVRYSDNNDGTGADAYALHPLFRRRNTTLHVGVSAAWRDTREDRFRFTGFRSEARSDGLFDYRFTGIYDPYWTPNDLREARLIASIQSTVGRARFHIQADGGAAQERARGFGPAFDVTPSPTFTFPIMLLRSFQPWRVSGQLTLPINSRIEFRARARREATAFYNVNEFEASLGGYL